VTDIRIVALVVTPLMALVVGCGAADWARRAS